MFVSKWKSVWREICYPINRASITQQRKQSATKSVLQYHHIATGVLLSNFSGDVLGPEFVDSAATAACEGQITVRRLKTRRTFEFVLFGVKNKMKKSLICHSYSTWTRGSDWIISQSKISSLFTSLPPPPVSPTPPPPTVTLGPDVSSPGKEAERLTSDNSALQLPFLHEKVWWGLHLYAPQVGPEKCASPLTSLLSSCDLPHIHYWSRLSVAWLPIDGRRLDCEVSWMYDPARNKRLWR